MPCFPCLDTESTGLSRPRNRLCEVAAIEFDPVTLAPHADPSSHVHRLVGRVKKRHETVFGTVILVSRHVTHVA